jgi:hypothetical protein
MKATCSAVASSAEVDDAHLRFAFGALQWVDLIDTLYTCGPTTFAELLPIVALLFFSRRRGELGSFTAAPTGITAEISSQRLLGSRHLTGGER